MFLRNRILLLAILMIAGWGPRWARVSSAAAPPDATPLPSSTSTYATWINVWIGQDQKRWWKPGDYLGAKVCIDGQWQSIDWSRKTHQVCYLDQIKAAGIQAVVADLTNGWGWLNARCQALQELCATRGLRFCVAENSKGDPAIFEQHAHDIWNRFAGPAAPQAGTYLLYHDKPLIVCYCIRRQFETIKASTGPWRSKFNVVWASGEDAAKDKWGWQLDPTVGAVPSGDSMFVTSSLKWSTGKTPDRWRKSLAWLDYNFTLARRNHPEFIIVGSYDDISERNGWMVADTTGAPPYRQMRDTNGALSQSAYYQRVQQWIAGTPAAVPGGCLPDGAYRIVNGATAKAISMHGNGGQVGAGLVQRTRGTSLEDQLWIYHLGGNRYRIIPLSSGLALGAPEKPAQTPTLVEQQWDDDSARQQWTLTPTNAARYIVTNNQTHMVLAPQDDSPTDGTPLIQQPPAQKASEQWRFEPAANPKSE